MKDKNNLQGFANPQVKDHSMLDNDLINCNYEIDNFNGDQFSFVLRKIGHLKFKKEKGIKPFILKSILFTTYSFHSERIIKKNLYDFQKKGELSLPVEEYLYSLPPFKTVLKYLEQLQHLNFLTFNLSSDNKIINISLNIKEICNAASELEETV